jgi:tetratricopeptide (TPR) repeat protein
MGRSADAEELLNKAMSSEQDAAIRGKYEAQMRSIWRHTDGRTAEVVSNLNAQIKSNPQDEKALRSLGQIHLKSRRDYEAALPVYEQLAALKPDDLEVQGALLNIYRETHNFDKIKAVYEAQLKKSAEDDPALRFQIAQTDLQAGKGDEAVAYAEKHLSGEKATPFQLQMLSSVYDKAGRKEQALTTLSTAIERSTDAQQKVSMQFQKADMLIWNKQYDEAETLLRAIRSANKDDKQIVSRVNSELIRIYQMQGKMGEVEL